MRSLRHILEAHPYFSGLDEAYLELITGCAKNVHFRQDDYLFRAGDEAQDFYVLRQGIVGLELDVNHKAMVVHTLGEGEILGWHWLVSPHQWQISARAVQTSRAIALDGTCLRRKCESDPALGFELMQRFARDMEKRLYRAWMQVVDVYG